jgi:hypothetical protein
VPGELVGQVDAGDHHAGRPAIGRRADRRRAAQQLAAGRQLLDRPVLAAGRRARRQHERRREAGRQARRRRLDDRRDRRRLAAGDAIDLHQAQLPLPELGAEDVADGREIAGRQVDGRERAGQPGGVCRDGSRPLGVIVAGNLPGRTDDRVDRRREPAAGGVANELAADQQHQYRGDQRQAEQRRDQLGAEAGERQGAPPLDHQLQDVARQHEDQRQHQRQVGDRHRVEDDRAEEVEREL